MDEKTLVSIENMILRNYGVPPYYEEIPAALAWLCSELRSIQDIEGELFNV